MQVLLTGSTGFVGKRIIEKLLLDSNIGLGVSVRKQNSQLASTASQTVIGDLSANIDWKIALLNVDVVIHVAARAHIMNELILNPLAEYRKVNTLATLSFAQQAAELGVKRFIFISSIKVNGDQTREGEKFKPNSSFIPNDDYGLSKYEAEQGLLQIAKETGMEVVIIRPPLVYGPGVKANFLSMIKWVERGIPLPFGAINNQRSLVALDNLVDFITHCIDHPKAANEIFLISDNKDVSTTQLLRKVALALGKRSMLIPIPVSWMKLVAKLFGKKAVTERLFSSLQVDSSKARALLGWQPVTTMDEQLKKTIDAYLNEKTV